MKPLFVLFAACGVLTAAPDAKEILKRSVAVNDADFKALPNYTHLETDTNSKGGSKTSRVVMLAGSPYYELIAINGEPLSAAERAKEEAKFRQESAKRRRESKEARDDRIAKYRDERQHEHLLMNEMARAFNFRLEGEAMIDGHKAYVLQATPKPGYRPINEKARVLTGMKGTLWIDSAQYHWVKVEAEVIHPVNFGLFIAKVRMGTRFELEQAPVETNVWEPKHFVQVVKAKILGIKSYDTREEETYTQYQPTTDQISRR